MVSPPNLTCAPTPLQISINSKRNDTKTNMSIITIGVPRFVVHCSYNFSPSRPAHPVSCKYSSMSSARPQWITQHTLGQSSPIPNTIVATTTQSRECVKTVPKFAF